MQREKNTTTEHQRLEERGAFKGPIRVPLHSLLFLFNNLGKRPELAVLTADYVKEASSELEAAFQGRSSAMRLTGWSAMRVSTSRK